MKKLVKVFAAAGTVAMLGVAVMPLTTYAATTNVEVSVSDECLIGDGSASNYQGATTLSVALNATNPYAETTATSGTNLIGAVCNSPTGYSISERVDHTDLKMAVSGVYSGATGFNVGANNATLSGFAPNTWSIKYADVSGTTVNAAAQTYNRSPSTNNTVIAATTGPTSLSTFSQQFGALTDGSVPTGTYGAVITYTLAPNAP